MSSRKELDIDTSCIWDVLTGDPLKKLPGLSLAFIALYD